MSTEIELFRDGDGLAVIGDVKDVDRFLTSQGLDRLPGRDLRMSKRAALLGNAAAATQVGSEFAAGSGRWVKLTAESAEAVHKYGLMPTKTPGVHHAMIGQPGDIGQWLQIAQKPSVLLAGPFVLPALATMMQQQAMQQQMDDIVDYLATIDEKVDDILRAQKDAVLADMIGVDLVLEEALTVRDEVGRVSDVTWSKVQGTAMTIARTQAYAVRQLDALADKLEKKADLGDIAKATREIEPRVLEWLAVIARCVQLQDGAAILELDRVLDAAPADIESHRIGLTAARTKRLAVIADSTARLLTRMRATIVEANDKVLLNPFDAPAAVRASSRVENGVIEFRERLSIESPDASADVKRWGQAATELRDKVLAAGADGAVAAKRFGDETFDRATEAFRAVDIDGDGVPDKPRAAAAAAEAGAALKGAADGVAGAFGTLFQRKRGNPKAADATQGDADD